MGVLPSTGSVLDRGFILARGHRVVEDAIHVTKTDDPRYAMKWRVAGIDEYRKPVIIEAFKCRREAEELFESEFLGIETENHGPTKKTKRKLAKLKESLSQ